MASTGVTDDKATGVLQKHRKKSILSAICAHFSLDPQNFSAEEEESDIKSLLTSVLKASGKETLLESNEVMHWLTFADSFLSDGCSDDVLKRFNVDLTTRSVLLCDGLKPSVADIVVFATLHSFMIALSSSERKNYPNVLRWMDYIQNKVDLGQGFEIIAVEKISFEPNVPKSVGKLETESSTKKGAQGPKTDDKSKVDSISKNSDKLEAVSGSGKNDTLEGETNSKKSSAKKKAGGDGKVTEEKKKAPEKESVEKDIEVSVSLLNIQVGLIRKAWKHPSADRHLPSLIFLFHSLLVEEIDLGEGSIRQVVSGLAKYCSPEDLINRRVALITNVKPGKLRDVASSGLVLCASNSEQMTVEPLLPPEGAKIGERVSFSGHDGKPEDVLNPKKKQLDKITPHLHTDDKGVATFKGIPFMTTAGPCTSSIPNASIK